MVKGIGVDIIEIQRMQESIEQSGEQFLQRIFTKHEIEYCRSKLNAYQHFAARFAAKEAVGKALSTGLRGKFSWKDIEVVNDELGKPNIQLHGNLREALNTMSILLSISHSNHSVVAMAVIEER